MSDVIIQFADSLVADQNKISGPLTQDYAKHHGFEYFIATDPAHCHGMHASFASLDLLRNAILSKCEYIIWLDCDCLPIGGTDPRLANTEPDTMALMKYDNAYKGRDWHYNCGVMFLCKPGERCQELIDRAWKHRSNPGFVNDEMCIIEAGEDMGANSPLRTLDRKWNAIPDRTPVETAEIIAFHARPNRIAQLLRYQLDYPAKFPRVAPTKPYFRPGTHDLGIFTCVVVNDEYGLRGMNLGAKDVCVDIGTHIGSFIVSAVTAGAGFVAGVEADPTNWTVAKWNVDAYLGREVAAQKTFIFEGAAWRSDSKKALEEDAKKWTHAGYTDNTGGGGMVPRTDGTKCNFIAFDDIVDLARSKSPSGRVRLLKMDCEGGEYACLYTSKRLKHVDEIRMEFHERTECPFGVATAEGLIAFLGKHGFKLTKRVNTAPALGLMYFAR